MIIDASFEGPQRSTRMMPSVLTGWTGQHHTTRMIDPWTVPSRVLQHDE